MSAPLMSFTSHTQGKNAVVTVFPDRIEWTKKGSDLAHKIKAASTAGLSLLGGRKEQVETILMRAVTNVSVKKDGLRNSKVLVTTAGGVIDFRVSHQEAEQLRNVILSSL